MKHVFAAYFSDARLNIMASLNDVREKSGLKRYKNEAENVQNFEGIFPKNIASDIRDKRITLLRIRFPFIETIVDPGRGKENPASKYGELSWLFQLVNDMRNVFIHSTGSEEEIDYQHHKKIFNALRKVYDCGLRTVKSRFQLENDTTMPLLRCDNRGRPKPFNKFSLALCTSPERNGNKKQSDVLHDFGRVLLCSLFLEKRQISGLVSHFWDKNGYGTDWNDSEQTIIRELLYVNRIRLPSQRLRTDSTLTSVTLDTISELARCPRPLFELLDADGQENFRVGRSPKNPQNRNDDPSYLLLRGHQSRFIPLAMRHLDFDSKCKLRFAVDLGQYYHSVRLKPAESFIDGNPGIRRLGQKIIAFGRLKDFEDAEKPEIWKKLEENGQKFAEEEEELLKRASITGSPEELKPYIIKTFPHYHLYRDKIGFCIDWEEKKDQKVKYPNLGVRGEDSKSTDSGGIKKRENRQLSRHQFWISPNKIIDLAFYHYLQTEIKQEITASVKTGRKKCPYPSVENILKEYYEGMVVLIKELKEQGPLPPWTEIPQISERRAECHRWINKEIIKAENFTISLADLPKAIRRHLKVLDSRETSVSDIIKRTKTMIEETCKKQKEIEYLLKYPKKRGKKGFRPIKHGNIADFLTEDLLRFQPKDSSKKNGGKLTSKNYQILQKAIAYYDKPYCIVDLLKKSGLLEGEFKHPFLCKIITEENHEQYSTLIDFYQKYLEERKAFLEGFIDTFVAGSSIPGWLRLRKPSTFESWLDQQLDEDEKLCQPLPVPKSLFYQMLLKMTAEKLDLTPEMLCKKGTQRFIRDSQEVEVKPSVSWFIRQYMEHRDDTAQEMYMFKRRHELFDFFHDKKKTTKKLHEEKTCCLSEKVRQEELESVHKGIEKLKKLLRTYKRSEKKIRHFSTMDMVLYLLAKKNFEKLILCDETSGPDWSLKTLETKILSTKIKYELNVPGTDRTIVHRACAIKKTGELRLLVRDRRLPSLLDYYPKTEKSIDQEEIKVELADYSCKRIEAMKLISDLEQKIEESCNRGFCKPVPDKLKKIFGAKKHGTLLYALYHRFHEEKDKSVDEQGFNKDCFAHARQIRNAFAHNEYPVSEQFNQIVRQVNETSQPHNHNSPVNHPKIADQLVKELDKLYKPWRNFLKRIAG